MRSALILNFTGNTYHYGCFGTSYEIYERLLQKGYYVNYSTVRATHGLALSPKSGEIFMDPKFANQYMVTNSPLTLAIEEADIVVVNGEGTLHRISNGSLSLLYQIFFTTRVLKKETYLINHSCYPSGGLEINPSLDNFYKEILKGINGIAAREGHSKALYDRLALKSVQGFDSLPLYFQRQGFFDRFKKTDKQKSVLLCGGINYGEDKLVLISALLKKMAVKVNFLLGGKAHLAREEEVIYQRFKSEGLKVKLVKATSFEEWSKTIADASLLISGRFHYTIAALALSTPCISFPSNTPKVEAVHELLGQQGFLSWDDVDFSEKLERYIVDGLDGGLLLDKQKHAYMLECAEQNFKIIPKA